MLGATQLQLLPSQCDVLDEEGDSLGEEIGEVGQHQMACGS